MQLPHHLHVITPSLLSDFPLRSHSLLTALFSLNWKLFTEGSVCLSASVKSVNLPLHPCGVVNEGQQQNTAGEGSLLVCLHWGRSGKKWDVGLLDGC